jgi:hypothetical protein
MVAASAVAIERRLPSESGPICAASSSIARVRRKPPERIVAPKAIGTVAMARLCEKRIHAVQLSESPNPWASLPLIGT